MLVTNSEFKFSGADVNKKKSSLMGRIVRTFDNGLCRMAEAGKSHADSPLLSVELALCRPMHGQEAIFSSSDCRPILTATLIARLSRP